MWIRKQQSNYCTRKWPCRAFLSVFFFGFAAVGRAVTVSDLTPEQLQNLIGQAVFTGVYDMNAFVGESYYAGDPWYYSFPVDENSVNLSYYLGPQGNPDYPYLAQILGFLQSSPTNDLFTVSGLVSNIVHQLDHNQQDTLGETLVYWLTSINDNLEDDTYGTPLLNKIRNLTYTQDNRLRVDIDQSALSDIGYDLSGLSGQLQSQAYDVSLLVSNLQTIAGFVEDYEESSQDAPSDFDDAVDDAEDDYDDSQDAAEDEYEEIPLPTSQEDYTTEAASPSGPSTSDVFGDVSSDGVSHSPLLQLVDRPAFRSSIDNPVPEIEVDFGRISAFQSFCLALDDLTNWLYPLLGGFFLSLKGLKMWRLVRQATIAASASGDPPVLHLAYDPF